MVMQLQRFREPPFDLQGGWGAEDKLFISTRLGGALNISNVVTWLHRTVLEVNYLYHT